MPDTAGEITRLLSKAQEGHADALNEVMELVYNDLHRMAEIQLVKRHRRGQPAVSLQPTELVSEAFLKLVKQRKRYDSRGHFFAIASKVMMRVLMDYHRTKSRTKRGGDQVRVSLSGVVGKMGKAPEIELPEFERALERIEASSPRTAEVAKMRLLWGLTVPEVADTLGLSLSTAEREWRDARGRLALELKK